MPIALDRSWPEGAGIVLMGMAGAVMPDYLDLRSDARGVLRHRGASHGLIVCGLCIALVWAIIRALTRLDDPDFALDAQMVNPLTLAFAVGIASHLLLDACTPRGIQPFLPFLKSRMWLLPRRLRIGTGGRRDTLLGLLATAAIVVVIAGRLLDEWP